MLRFATNRQTMSSSLPRQLRELVGVYLLAQRRFIADQGLPPQGHLLMRLKRLGPVTQGEFGRAVGLDKSWISRIVDRFVADGLVERIPLEADRRCLQLMLTAAGVEQAALMDRQLSAHAAQLIAPVPADARPALGEALAALIDALRQSAAKAS